LLFHFTEDGKVYDANSPADPISHYDIHEKRVLDSMPKSYLTMNDHVSFRHSTSFHRVPKSERQDGPNPRSRQGRDWKSKVSSETDTVQEKKGTRHPRNQYPRGGKVQSAMRAVIFYGMTRTRPVQVD
jgi:hypothetical protein